MIKRLELQGPSCLTNASFEEPIFVLRANDELAPIIVREWARLYAGQKFAAQGGLTLRQQAKYEDAQRTAVLMEQWKE